MFVGSFERLSYTNHVVTNLSRLAFQISLYQEQYKRILWGSLPPCLLY